MSDKQNQAQGIIEIDAAIPEMCARDHAPITIQRFGRGYRCSAVVDGNLMSLYYPSCTLSAAFTAFEQLISKEVR